MRLPIAALLLCLSPLAIAAEPATPVMPMPAYLDYMKSCVNFELEHQGARAEEREVQALVGIHCQCRFDRLPPQGRLVTPDVYAGAAQGCESERWQDEPLFWKKYASHLKMRNSR